MRPDLACTVFLACLELLKCVEVTQADRVKPSCLMQVASAAPVPCGYFEHSDACCIEPLDTRHVQSTQRHLAGGVQGPSWQQHSNVTFTAPTEDALYLVSHDEGCGPEHECWEVSLRALGPLESLLLPAGAALQVLVSHLPGPKAYNVSLTTATVSRGGSGPGPAPRPGSSTEDCRLLRGSTPVLDIVGDDASVRLVPPGVPQQGDAEPDALPALPGVCVTLHSDQCPVDCRDFTVPPQCRRTRFHQTERCVDKPFDSALTFRNVTRLNVSSRLDAGPVNSSHVVPLLFHCARLQLGGCVVATATVAVPLHPPSVRAEVMVPDKWTTTSNAVVLAAALTLLCVLLLFAVRNFCRGPPHRSLLILQVAGGGAADGDTVGNRALKSSLSRLSLRRASLKGGVSVAPAPAEARRLLLVYCKDGAGPESATGRAFSGAVRVLARILSASGRIEVTDMHEDPLLPEEGPVLRASTVLADESTCLVLVATPALAEALRPTTTVLDLDIFQKFVSALLLCLSHTPRSAPARLFTVCLDARHHPNFLIGIPVTAVFVMPFHVADLVEAIPGLAGEAIPSEKQFQADELKLRKYVNQYVNPDEPETPVIVRI